MKISRKQRYKLAVLVLALLQTPRYLKESILIQPLAKQNFQKTEFVPRYAKVLLGELKEEAKVELMSTYLPPENVKAFLPITINPEGLKEPLQKTSISESLFGTKLENTIQVAKKLEKLGEQLKLKKIKPPSRSFATEVQQTGHGFQKRTPPQRNIRKRTKSHRPYATPRRSNSLKRGLPY
nr:unnamed protein product [Callosobruchus analis]